MGRGRPVRQSGETSLVKSAMVSDGTRVCLILYLRTTANKKTLFRGILARTETPEEWEKIIGGLSEFQPAEIFGTGMLGAETDLPMFKERLFTVYDAKRWLSGKLSGGTVTLREFLEREKTATHPFPEELFGRKKGGLLSLESGKWHLQEITRSKKNRTKRVVF